MKKYACLQNLQDEHQKILRMQSECVSENGYVYTDRRNEYNDLCKKERKIRDAIFYLEEMQLNKI